MATVFIDFSMKSTIHRALGLPMRTSRPGLAPQTAMRSTRRARTAPRPPHRSSMVVPWEEMGKWWEWHPEPSTYHITSGQRLHNYGKIQTIMERSTILGKLAISTGPCSICSITRGPLMGEHLMNMWHKRLGFEFADVSGINGTPINTSQILPQRWHRQLTVGLEFHVA